jgi:hypothetical protein
MKFCGECAAPLSSACPSCGAANPPGHKFCGQCAAPLRTVPTAPSVAPESYTPKHLAERIINSKTALEGERRQLRDAEIVALLEHAERLESCAAGRWAQARQRLCT